MWPGDVLKHAGWYSSIYSYSLRISSHFAHKDSDCPYWQGILVWARSTGNGLGQVLVLLP
jgi:hypothetical protein